MATLTLISLNSRSSNKSFGLFLFQVIDTPGILDHSLEERNTIEMQAITALAHLRAAILYVMDVSEQCGHTVEEQVTSHLLILVKVDLAWRFKTEVFPLIGSTDSDRDQVRRHKVPEVSGRNQRAQSRNQNQGQTEVMDLILTNP